MYSVAAPLCLVAEDQALIAMGLEADLSDAGITIAGPFPSSAEALDWIAGHTPDVALLDVLLEDGSCTAVARALVGRGVPVLILSGLPHDRSIPPDLRDLPWIEKPVAGRDLVGALLRLLPISHHAMAGVIERASFSRG